MQNWTNRTFCVHGVWLSSMDQPVQRSIRYFSSIFANCLSTLDTSAKRKTHFASSELCDLRDDWNLTPSPYQTPVWL
uniref:Uncharacterized protein n=1 Tax=Steinernema glaseri TaxID=37863 RepID=A0A1I7ZBU4_9BILA